MAAVVTATVPATTAAAATGWSQPPQRPLQPPPCTFTLTFCCTLTLLTLVLRTSLVRTSALLWLACAPCRAPPPPPPPPPRCAPETSVMTRLITTTATHEARTGLPNDV